MELDTLCVHVTFAAAGELQMEAHEVGIEHVAEADVRRAMRRARGAKTEDGTYILTTPDFPGVVACRSTLTDLSVTI